MTTPADLGDPGLRDICWPWPMCHLYTEFCKNWLCNFS